jgi:hypothetical protein
MAFGKKKLAFFLALFAALSYADNVITRNFTYVPDDNPTSSVYTNINITPTLSIPASAT